MMLSLEGVGDDAPPSLPVYLSSHQRRQRNVTGRIEAGFSFFEKMTRREKARKMTLK